MFLRMLRSLSVPASGPGSGLEAGPESRSGSGPGSVRSFVTGLLSCLVLCISVALAGQEPGPVRLAQTALKTNSQKPRVFVTDSQSWEASNAGVGSDGLSGAKAHGGTRTQTAAVFKTLGERCSQVIVNNKLDSADYIIVLDRVGRENYLRHRNKVAVFAKNSGDVVISDATMTHVGSVTQACNGIVRDWAAHSHELLAAKAKTATLAATPGLAGLTAALPAVSASLAIDSTPAGADIEIDGSFFGNTPSTVSIGPGVHQISVKKKGFTDWSKALNVTGGSIYLNAGLNLASPAQ
jgi:hypothetical protein